MWQTVRPQPLSQSLIHVAHCNASTPTRGIKTRGRLQGLNTNHNLKKMWQTARPQPQTQFLRNMADSKALTTVNKLSKVGTLSKSSNFSLAIK